MQIGAIHGRFCQNVSSLLQTALAPNAPGDTYFSTPSLPVTTGSLANSEERMMQEVHIAVELGSYARGAELTVGLSARAGHSTLPY